MHVLHQQIAVTHHGLTFRGGTTADGDILADGVVVANLTGSLLALEFQVLRLRRDTGSWEELIAVADTCAEMDRDIVEETVVVANDHILVDHTERTDDITVAQLCLWVYNC